MRRFNGWVGKRSSILVLALLLGAGIFFPRRLEAQNTPRGQQHRDPDTIPTLGLDSGTRTFETGSFRLELVRASQTAAGLHPLSNPDFDFTPGDRLEARSLNRHHHLGDLDLRYRVGNDVEWHDASTAAHREPVDPLPVSPPTLAAADLGPTLPGDLPLNVRRYWEEVGGELGLRFEVENPGPEPVEIGSVGIPMVFNNILTGRSLEEAHAVASFNDPYIGLDAGYVQVTRLSGHGPVLLVVPGAGTPLEAWNPLLSERTRRGVTFEGFYEWMPLSLAYAEEEWRGADSWNPASSVVLAPGEVRSWKVRFLLAPEIRSIEATLEENHRPVAMGIPGYVLPTDMEGQLFLKAESAISEIVVQPAATLAVEPDGTTPGGWLRFRVRGTGWGRARVEIRYADGTAQAIHYKVIKPQTQVVADLGRFLTTAQWFEDASDPFGRSPSVISYDYDEQRQVTEDNRAWIAGLGDEGGSGSWLAAVMKQLIQPDSAELAKLQRFVDGVLWGGLQYADGDRAYGVRKSMFYYEPDSMPPGTYSEDLGYGGWSSWSREEAMSVGRSYDYPHVAAAHWVLYRLARNHTGLVDNHPWEWYLERAWRTGVAMVRHAPHYAQFGQMDGTVFLLILEDLKREGWTEAAIEFQGVMRQRAEVWRSLGYPFGSEMPWDSTGQEEVYGWSRYFGFHEKAMVTLNAILGYMPTVPHWGYNGSARRYWDFQYAGKLRRVERQLHHYGSGLNAIPVLSAYRDSPGDFYLLRVGYGGVLGAIANITREGFGPCGFHAYPSTLRIDGYSGDYGPNFFGHAVNVGSYLVHHPEFGWLAFGGFVEVEDGAGLGINGGPDPDLVGGPHGEQRIGQGRSAVDPDSIRRRTPGEAAGGASAPGATRVRLTPLDAARSRIFLAPLGLWLTLDSGTFEAVELEEDVVRIFLSPATPHTPVARLRIQALGTAGMDFLPGDDLEMERGAYRIPLGPAPTEVVLREAGSE